MSRKIVAASAALATAGAMLIAAPGAEAAGRGITHVSVTKKHTVHAPAKLRPGLVHLRNDGKREVLVVRKKREGVPQLVKYLNSEKLSNRVFTRFALVEVLTSHADDYVRLARGTYYLVGEGTKFRTSSVRTVVVKGKTKNAGRPAAAGVTITRKGTLTGATTGVAKSALRLRNHASSPRAVAAIRVPAKVTEAMLTDLVARPSFDKLYDVVGDGFGSLRAIAFLGQRQDVTVTPGLRAGRYLLWAVPPFSNGGSVHAGQLSRLTLR